MTNDWKLPIMDCVIKAIEYGSDVVFLTFYNEDLNQELKTSLSLEKCNDIGAVSIGDECALKIYVKGEAIKKLGLSKNQFILKLPIKKIPYDDFYVDVFMGAPRIWHRGFLIKRWNIKEE
ncbi:unnamed protein product [marine sediment metagenome]|uniref:Uncharacterized protein n=1 Tax=marine sediment metagenome TaxID=412755 RepID=X1THU5_9ZZZZ